MANDRESFIRFCQKLDRQCYATFVEIDAHHKAAIVVWEESNLGVFVWDLQYLVYCEDSENSLNSQKEGELRKEHLQGACPNKQVIANYLRKECEKQEISSDEAISILLDRVEENLR